MKAITKIFVFLLFSAFLYSCGCQYHLKRIQKRCGDLNTKTDSVSIIDSSSVEVVEKIKVKDTTIFINVPGPIQYIPNPCSELCDSLGNLKPFNRTDSKNGIKSEIKTVGNVLVFDCKTDSLQAVIRILQKEVEITKTKLQKKSRSQRQTITVNKLSGFQKFCVWFFFGVVFLFLYWVYRVFKR